MRLTALCPAIAIAVAALPCAAAARSQAELDCVSHRAPVQLDDDIAAAMAAADPVRLRPLRQQLGQLVRQCAVALRMSDAEAEVYDDYVLARLPRDALARQLAKAGISTAGIDEAMGYGPGRQNRLLRELGEEEMAGAMAALKDRGIENAGAGEASWSKVLTYLELTPRMYRYLESLRQPVAGN